MFWCLYYFDTPCVCRGTEHASKHVGWASSALSAFSGSPNNNAASEKLTSPPAHQRSCASRTEEWGVTLSCFIIPFADTLHQATKGNQNMDQARSPANTKRKQPQPSTKQTKHERTANTSAIYSYMTSQNPLVNIAPFPSLS